MSRLRWSSILLPSFVCISCATYQSKVEEPRNLLKSGRYSEASEKFKKLAEESSRDQLVYLMDYATVLQLQGEYKASSDAFIKADKLVDVNDFHSVSNVTMATLGGEEMIQYKGESYEKFLINTMNALNFLMLDQYDEALVEARIINEKINKMRLEGRDPYDQSPFARYLSGLLWEAQGKYDDAYIEYEAAYKLDSQNPFIKDDLVRLARLSRRSDQLKKWINEFGVSEDTTQTKKESGKKSEGELIVLFQQGWGPEKHTRRQYRFPELYPVFSNSRAAKIEVNGSSFQTQIVYNISKVAMETMEKDFGALVARRIGGIVVKEVVADQIRQKNQLAGDLALIAMYLSDRADLRQWSTLPETIQMGKKLLPAGKYKINISALDSSGNASGEIFEKEIEIKPGRKTFVSWRAIK